MAKKLQPPCASPKRGLPWELKYNYVRGQMTTLFKGFLYAIREEYGAAAALKITEKMWRFKDRVKNMINTFLSVFEIQGNDLEKLAEFWDVYWEIQGSEAIILERSKTINRTKITKCPWSTPDPKDISGWCEIWANIVSESINPKISTKRLKGMCAGDPYCEYVWRIED
ncbi:hypothetical protein [Candidatus Borrarchaeum sp.]|uniref:hypothetical protein n=1 Tax=Candidatus Borrarchaeum sp. TaxID=2846742 RepID=UPI00257CE7A3|nr:hypothetical protein [Candidatus Borrarchaeum sp.]